MDQIATHNTAQRESPARVSAGQSRHDTAQVRRGGSAISGWSGQPVKMSVLSQMLLVSNGNATTVVDRLEKDGLAAREQSGEDKRVVFVGLTPAGNRWFKDLADAHENEVNALFAALGHDDLNLVRDLMHRLEGDADDQDV